MYSLARIRPVFFAAVFFGLCLIVAATPQLASAASFKVSVRGTQYLKWSLDGTRGSCEIRRGMGGGEVNFAFKSAKAQPVFVGKSGRRLEVTGSIPSVATGTITGQFSDTLATACPNFAPADPYIPPTAGCGASKFGIRMDLQTRGAFVYVTGPNVPLTSGSTSASPGGCPFPIDSSLLFSSDLSACGDGSNLWQRSWGMAFSNGEGLFAGKLSISARKLLKTKKRRSAIITGRSVVSCNVASQYSGGVTYGGQLKYTLTFKRTG